MKRFHIHLFLLVSIVVLSLISFILVSSGNSDPLDSGNSGTPKNLQKG